MHLKRLCPARCRRIRQMDHLVTAKCCFIEADGDIGVKVTAPAAKATACTGKSIAETTVSAAKAASESTVSAGESFSKSAAEMIRSASSACSGTAAGESAAKDIFQDIIHVTALKMELLVSAICSAKRSLTALVIGTAELVIHFLFLRITEHRVGFCDLFELLGCLCISGIGIRMIFLCQFTVCFFDCIFICVFIYSKDFIIIFSFFHF